MPAERQQGGLRVSGLPLLSPWCQLLQLHLLGAAVSCTPFNPRGERVGLGYERGVGKKHENCCSHYALGLNACKWLGFPSTAVANALVLLVKQNPTFLLLFIFGKWCIITFWTWGLVKSTDISFLSSYSGPFLFALYGKGLERFLLFPSPSLFLVQSFILNIQTFYRLPSFKTEFLFFPPLHKRILLADWVLSIANCGLFCLVSPASFIEGGPLSKSSLAPRRAQLCMKGVVLYQRNMSSCSSEGLNALRLLPFCFVKGAGLCCEIINPPIFSSVRLWQVGEQRPSWMHLLLCWNQLKVPIQVVSAQCS